MLLFPELTLTGATLGDLYLHMPLITAAEQAVLDFAQRTAELGILSVIGAPLMLEGRLYNCAVAVSGGQVLAIIPAAPAFGDGRHFSAYDGEDTEVLFGEEPVPFGRGITLFSGCAEGFTVSVAVGEGAKAPLANICLNPAASAELIGSEEYTEALVKAASIESACAYIYAGAGVGESGTDLQFSGRAMAYQCGKLLGKNKPFSEEELFFCEVDLGICSHEKLARGIGSDTGFAIGFGLPERNIEIMCPPSATPFVPQCESELSSRCERILELQSRALAKRLERSYSRTAVLGISGGLDSTLAILVAVRAADLLGRDRRSVIAVTMPCFGTSKRTKGNAKKLSEALGVDFRTVDIRAAVSQHFADIGHDPECRDVVYENSQARERTQVLMDIANAEGGIVVGTGDLSELALGFATYNGDHMSMFGVNGSIPKTLMRSMVSHIAAQYERAGNSDVARVLLDIVNTPVSPELLPTGENDKIAQQTEGIVGPYELHDFFIYYTVRYGFSPAKTVRLAEAAFCGKYDRRTIKGWLRIFIKRFFSSQFKRSCLPDGVKVGSVSLSPRGDFAAPSDMTSALWLAELDSIPD